MRVGRELFHHGAKLKLVKFICAFGMNTYWECRNISLPSEPITIYSFRLEGCEEDDHSYPKRQAKPRHPKAKQWKPATRKVKKGKQRMFKRQIPRS